MAAAVPPGRSPFSSEYRGPADHKDTGPRADRPNGKPATTGASAAAAAAAKPTKGPGDPTINRYASQIEYMANTHQFAMDNHEQLLYDMDMLEAMFMGTGEPKAMASALVALKGLSDADRDNAVRAAGSAQKALDVVLSPSEQAIYNDDALQRLGQSRDFAPVDDGETIFANCRIVIKDPVATNNRLRVSLHPLSWTPNIVRRLKLESPAAVKALLTSVKVRLLGTGPAPVASAVVYCDRELQLDDHCARFARAHQLHGSAKVTKRDDQPTMEMSFLDGARRWIFDHRELTQVLDYNSIRDVDLKLAQHSSDLAQAERRRKTLRFALRQPLDCLTLRNGLQHGTGSTVVDVPIMTTDPAAGITMQAQLLILRRLALVILRGSTEVGDAPKSSEDEKSNGDAKLAYEMRLFKALQSCIQLSGSGRTQAVYMRLRSDRLFAHLYRLTSIIDCFGRARMLPVGSDQPSGSIDVEFELHGRLPAGPIACDAHLELFVLDRDVRAIE